LPKPVIHGFTLHAKGRATGAELKAMTTDSKLRPAECCNPESPAPRARRRRRALLVSLTILACVATTAVVAAMPSAEARAQAPASTGLEGTWQGTLKVPSGQQLRTVIKIAKNPDGTLKSTFYSIDQGGGSIVATSTTFQGGDVKISIERINLVFTGKMSADGNSITGEVTQGTPLPLVLVRSTPATEWTIPEPPKPVPPMPADANPTFEVATIKPSKPDEPGKLFGVRAGKFKTINFTLGDMISAAYGVQAKQVIGTPDWVWTEKYDIDAQSDTPGMPSRTQLMNEVQKLMADRFQLKFHRETRELSALILTVGKTGPKLKASEGGPKGLPGLFFQGVGILNVTNATIPDFTGLMQSAVLDRPVVDHTGLTGKYDFRLKWTPDDAQLAQMGMKAPPTEAADAPPNLFTALQEQLGLKLESGKAQVEVLVVDKVEHPSAN
jgi:uncharacterized protein (TIGR03435 family)